MINEKKANIFMNGPAILEINTLTEKVKTLRNDVLLGKYD
jgi:hypothetical protein